MLPLKKSTTLCLLIVFCFIVTTSFFSTKKISCSPEKSILVISSYSPSFPTFNQQIEGIKSELDNSEILIDIEFMDTKRFNTEENINNFLNSLKYKITNTKKYNGVIVCDDNALDFINIYKDDLLKEIPIVFLGVNDVNKAIKFSSNPYITGVTEAISMDETISLALKFQSNAKNIIALVDGTTSGQCDLKSYYALKNKYKTLNFTDINLDNFNFAEYSKEVATISEKDIILLLSAYTDKMGISVNFYESLELIKENSKAPIFHLWSHGIGEGILGGKVISHFEQGKAAANLINQILDDGLPPEKIPFISQTPNKFMFDYIQLKKFNIESSLIPKDSIILNKESSFYERYRKLLIFSSLTLSAFLVIIFLLLTNIRKRKVAEKRLIQKNGELNFTHEKLKNQLSKVHQYAYYDKLTGLPNKTNFKYHFNKFIQSFNEHTNTLSLVFIDIDNFKIINDTYGHSIGDKLLLKVSALLKELTLENSYLARLGGDEFVILLENHHSKELIEAEVKRISKNLEKHFCIGENKFYITASIGIAICPDHGVSYSDLMKNADAAMNKAKEKGRNCYKFFKKEINDELNRKLVLQNGLRKAISNEEFVLYYQPIIGVTNGKIKGFEALIRWVSPEFGFVSPNDFIKLSEEMGLILDIGKWVIKNALLFSEKINVGKKEKLVVSVNVSAIQLKQINFIDSVNEIIQTTGIDPTLINFEITETSLIDNFESCSLTLNALKEMGIKISLDDFGTGYSSLSYLTKLPIDTLKIDKSFVDAINKTSNEKDLIQSIIYIAHKFGLNVVAEGVEYPNQAKQLQKYKCDMLQGYLYSKPLPEDSIFEKFDT
ncbi:hypothetical protein SH2C18_44310 [Clostridium sediminicola]|uniref:ABC transporter substrate binding protein n=1 Tax=Clostridium sediminicola TaxID=3114879 RepID=UPI0031F1E149